MGNAFEANKGDKRYGRQTGGEGSEKLITMAAFSETDRILLVPSAGVGVKFAVAVVLQFVLNIKLAAVRRAEDAAQGALRAQKEAADQSVREILASIEAPGAWSAWSWADSQRTRACTRAAPSR